MTDTSASLLDRLQEAGNPQAWQCLVDVYQPMIRRWLGKYQLREADVDDIMQEVLSVLIRRMPEFQRQRTGSFRRWLRTITVNCLRDYAKRHFKHPAATGGSEFAALVEQLADDSSGQSQMWEQEHQQHLIDWLLETIRPEFQEATWQAFRGVAIEGKSAKVVAAEQGITTNAVFIAKSRVLSRLRQEGAGLIE